MSDYYTKWPMAKAVPNQEAPTVAQAFLEEVICNHGAPSTVLSDQGAQFLSKLFKYINATLGTKEQHTTAYHPQTDGLVERFNGTLVKMLSAYTSEKQDDWDEYLPFVLWVY